MRFLASEKTFESSLGNTVLPKKVNLTDDLLSDLRRFVCVFSQARKLWLPPVFELVAATCHRQVASKIRISSSECHTNKKTHPVGWVFLLVDLRRFELPTPTMRMWCAPSCATSPYAAAFTAAKLYRLCFLLSRRIYFLMEYSTGTSAGISSSQGCSKSSFTKAMVPE